MDDGSPKELAPVTDEAHGFYVEYHRDMRRPQSRSYQDTDQAILTLSPVGLGFSFAFISDLASEPAGMWALLASWGCHELSVDPV